MAALTTGSILGVLAILAVATGLSVMGDGHREEGGGSLERACAGLPTDRQLEDALASARALSNGGFDQICASFQAQQPRPDPYSNSR